MFTFGSRHASENSVRVRFAGHNCSKVYVYVYVYIYIMQIYIDKKTFFNNMMFFHVFPIQADVQVLTRRGETPGGALP